MNLSNSLDLLMTTVATNTSTATSGSSSKEGSSEFETLLQDQASNPQSSDTSSSGTSESGGTASDNSSESTAGVVQGATEEITDLERQLMAALTMQNMLVQPTEVTVEGELLVEEVELVLAVEEVELDFAPEAEVEMVLDPTFQGELVEQVVATEGAIVLDETLETEVEFELDLSEEVEEVVETEAVELEEVVETETVTLEAEVEQEDNTSEQDVTVVDGQGQGTRVFEKADSTTVKVGETVNSESPDFDSVMAKVISQADENGDSTITIQLTPESLGTVTIQLSKTSDGVLQIVMQAADSAAAKLLNSHADGIAAALRGAGTTVLVEVEAQEVAENRDDMNQEKQHERQEHEEKEKDGDEEISYGEDFMQQMRLGLLQMNPETMI